MRYLIFPGSFFTCFLFLSCVSTKESAKYQLSDGIYKITYPYGKKRYYVLVKEDSIKAYDITKREQVDTGKKEAISIDLNKGTGKLFKYRFSQSSFDIDVISIPLKFRLRTSSFPNQLTSNINGAVYLGKRTDFYFLKKTQNRLGVSSSSINHYGVSVGIFTGLGATAINSWVTDNAINFEYDGALIPMGATGLIAVNNFNFGVAVGFDQLLDKNKKYWIYRNKPWIGFTLGLNLY